MDKNCLRRLQNHGKEDYKREDWMLPSAIFFFFAIFELLTIFQVACSAAIVVCTHAIYFFIFFLFDYGAVFFFFCGPLSHLIYSL